MLPETSAFRERSIAVAKRFLQTVVVVDDEAYYPQPDSPQGTTVVHPGIESAVEATEQNEQISESPERPVQPVPGGRHTLNAKRFIDSFARNGLICSIVRPEESKELAPIDQDRPASAANSYQGQLIGTTMQIIKRADLVIIDWRINQDYGDQAILMIKNILLQDSGEHKAHLRLIAIYTGDDELDPIVNRVSQELGMEREPDTPAARKGPVRVVVFAKESAKVPTHHDDRKASPEELPARLVEEFATMTGGLISNVAISALAVLRANTYSLLTVLDKDLDAAYLTHRLLLTQPDDAAELLVSTIVSELRSVLDEHSIGSDAGREAIQDWMAATHDAGVTFEIKDHSLSRDEMEQWLLTGQLKDLGNKKIESAKSKNYSKLTEILSGGGDGYALDSRFAMLTSLRTRHRQEPVPPMLTLGTIVEDMSESAEYRFWMCIQPRCDSVRLKDNVKFPFLPYESYGVEESSNEKFNVVIRDGSASFAYLKLRNAPAEVRTAQFIIVNDEDPVVRAIEDGGQFVFQAEGGSRFRWVAELKHEQAQREIARLASHISRIGLDESEWLRRSNKGS